MLDFVPAPIPEEATTGYGLGFARLQIGDTLLFGHLGGAVGLQRFPAAGEVMKQTVT